MKIEWKWKVTILICYDFLNIPITDGSDNSCFHLVGNGAPAFISETEDCTYQFEWATPLACPPVKMIECSYRHDKEQYDLAPLAGIEDNYKVTSNSIDKRGVFYINMCRSLLHKEGVQGMWNLYLLIVHFIMQHAVLWLCYRPVDFCLQFVVIIGLVPGLSKRSTLLWMGNRTGWYT